MGAIKPGLQGEHAISVKAIAQGMPDDSAGPVVTAASFFVCWRAMGCGQHPAFPAPSSLLEGENHAKLGRDRAAGMRCFADTPSCERPVRRSSKSEGGS